MWIYGILGYSLNLINHQKIQTSSFLSNFISTKLGMPFWGLFYYFSWIRYDEKMSLWNFRNITWQQNKICAFVGFSYESDQKQAWINELLQGIFDRLSQYFNEFHKMLETYKDNSKVRLKCCYASCTVAQYWFVSKKHEQRWTRFQKLWFFLWLKN